MVGPKMYATDEVQDTEGSIATQKLCKLRELEDLNYLEREAERGNFTSQFVASVFLEDYYKQFLDEVLAKRVMNG